MNKKPLFFLLSLCPLIPTASRLAYGIVISIAMLWYLATGIIFKELFNKITPQKTSRYPELISTVAAATLFHLMLQAVSPILASSLSLYLYVSAFSYLLMINIDSFSIFKPFSGSIILFLPFMIAFSLLREILGSGTISLPSKDGLLIFTILPHFSEWGLGFWGTSGGALIILGILTWLITYVLRQSIIPKRDI